jgi:hypothetical protein
MWRNETMDSNCCTLLSQVRVVIVSSCRARARREQQVESEEGESERNKKAMRRQKGEISNCRRWILRSDAEQ